MEKVNQKIHRMSLKKSLVYLFVIFIISIAVLTMITVSICVTIQRKVLDSRTFSFQIGKTERQKNRSFEHEVNSEYEWSPLSGNQNAVYYGSVVVMIALPVIYVVLGVILAAAFYYRTKLEKPLCLLTLGIHNVTEGNLDFEMKYECMDELGRLCGAVEMMRKELQRDKKQILELLDDRRALNASVSHDLGTPLTIVKGYLEYLQKDIPQDKVAELVLMDTLAYMSEAVNRIEQYINCVRGVQKLDEIEVCPHAVRAEDVVTELKSNFQKVSEKHGKNILVLREGENQTLNIDKQMFFRILENVLENACRYAKNGVKVELKMQEDFLSAAITDDGKGFSKEVLETAASLFYTSSESNNNLGLGLYICKVLCRKHGGDLLLSNDMNGGGRVLVLIKINGFQ